ncbi:MAG: phospholipase [Gluconacetobacter diazotrophicus]|nr:phospholipase [Gluconacetobacter diazotrophicus]
MRAMALVLLFVAAAPPALAQEAPAFRIVESVPEASVYGEPGVPRTVDVWLEMIGEARSTLDIAAFYVADKTGHAMSRVLDAIVDRARAGVKVRILVERSFMRDTGPSTERLKGVPNLELRVIDTGHLTGGVLHAKYMVVDGERVFVGSQNFDWRALEEIHEIGAEVIDPRFGATMGAAFAELWEVAGSGDLPRAEKAAGAPATFRPATEADPVLLRGNGGETLVAFPAFSPPTLTPDWLTREEPALVEAIRQARRSIRIQVMTMSALKGYGAKGFWPGLDSALRDAAARGVDVRIVVADWALHEPMQSYLKSLAVMPNIQVRFSAVPPAPGGFIPFARVEHCKYMVVDDDESFIGTGNWEWSYFANTVDASVFVRGTGPARTLAAIFERDWNGPYVTALTADKRFAPPRTQ